MHLVFRSALNDQLGARPLETVRTFRPRNLAITNDRKTVVMPNDADVLLQFRRPNHVRVAVALDCDFRAANLRSPIQSVRRKTNQLHVADLRRVKRLVTPRRIFLAKILVNTGSGWATDDDVVLFVAIKLDQAKLWFFPVDAVFGCGVQDRFVPFIWFGGHVVCCGRVPLGQRCFCRPLVNDERAVPAFV